MAFSGAAAAAAAGAAGAFCSRCTLHLCSSTIHDAWARGTLPVWTPEVSGGRPLAPNPNVGAFYPVRILLSRVPFPLAMRIYPVVHWMAAGIGMLVLLSALQAVTFQWWRADSE